jgi:lipopolysaccharide transport system ATP-binding protein
MNGNESDKENKEFWALEDVSFEAKPGEVLGIIGPNGSGKSTTLKLLSRILRPDGGSITVHGRIGALIELGAGFNPDLTGRENVFLNAAILGMSKHEIQKKYDEIVDFAELYEFMDTPVKWYSSGMFARLGFSVAVHIDPEVLLVDEVLSVGDLGFQRKCFDKMKTFKSKGTTVVFVSHNLQAVSSLCDRVLLLRKGNKDCIGQADEVISSYIGSIDSYGHENNDDSGIIVEGATLKDENGTERHSYESGDVVLFDCRLRVTKELKDIYIGALIHTQRETLAFATNSMRLSGKAFSVSPGQKVSFTTRLTLNLGPGRYEVRVAVLDRKTNKDILYHLFSNIVIKDDPKYGGMVFMDPRLVNFEIE